MFKIKCHIVLHLSRCPQLKLFFFSFQWNTSISYLILLTYKKIISLGRLEVLLFKTWVSMLLLVGRFGQTTKHKNRILINLLAVFYMLGILVGRRGKIEYFGALEEKTKWMNEKHDQMNDIIEVISTHIQFVQPASNGWSIAKLFSI